MGPLTSPAWLDYREAAHRIERSEATIKRYRRNGMPMPLREGAGSFAKMCCSPGIAIDCAPGRSISSGCVDCQRIGREAIKRASIVEPQLLGGCARDDPRIESSQVTLNL